MNEFTAIIEMDEAGEYFAYCPEIKYAYVSGKTVEEALNHLKDVVQLQVGEIKKTTFKYNRPIFVSRLQLYA